MCTYYNYQWKVRIATCLIFTKFSEYPVDFFNRLLGGGGGRENLQIRRFVSLNKCFKKINAEIHFTQGYDRHKKKRKINVVRNKQKKNFSVSRKYIEYIQ